MQCSKETKILNCVCIGLVILAGATRVVGYTKIGEHTRILAHNGVLCMLFTTAALIWLFQLRKRLLQPTVKRYLTGLAVLIIFWIALRTVKYEFLPPNHPTARHCWYLYYLPQTFGVLLLFLSVLHIGLPHDRPIDRRWKLLYIPAAVITIGILTNDFHQLAFRFPEGIKNWDRCPYTYGPLYLLAMVWIAVLFIGILRVVFIRCAVPGRRKYIWVPLIPLALAVVYFAIFLLDEQNILLFPLQVPEFVCVFIAVFTECLIVTRLLPSNDSYNEFWNASSIGAGIMDKSGVIRYRSAHSLPVTPEQVRGAQESAVFFEDGNIALRSHTIHGGYGYWFKDLTEINSLNRKLASFGDLLAEENDLLDAENRLAEKRMRIKQQNRLYNGIAQSIRPQLNKISRLLDAPPENEEEFIRQMKIACILSAYIKRRSNLLLLMRQNRQIDSEELSLSIAESLEYLRLCGIKAYGAYKTEGPLPGEHIVLAYKLFELVLEAAIPGTSAVLVNLQVTGGQLSLRIEMSTPRKVLPARFMRGEITALRGKLEIEADPETAYVYLLLPPGGGES